MQPLPPTITTNVFREASTGFEQAAGMLASADSAHVLKGAARSAFQGLPSLRMSSGSDASTLELATQLTDAASAAIELSSNIATAPAGTDFSGYRDTLLGWSKLAAAAAIIASPLTFSY